MQLNEALARIVGRHWRLIAACVIVLASLAAAVRLSQPPSYVGTTRFVLDTGDPTSRVESESVADAARAIATSPSQVAGAIADARVRGRDATDVAGHHVRVRSLGASSVLELRVDDRDRGVAAALSRTLAKRVIATRLKSTQGDVEQVLADLGRRIDGATTKIPKLDDQIGALTIAMARTRSPRAANELRRKRDDLARQRDIVSQRLSVMESQRVAVLSNTALKPRPDIISADRPVERASTSAALPDIVLAAMLGVVLGVGAASIREMVRPTLVGGSMVAAELGAPLLGTLSAHPDGEIPHNALRRLAARLALAGRRAGVRHVRLLAAADEVDLERFANRLSRAHDEDAVLTAVPAAAPIAVGGGARPAHGAEGAARSTGEPAGVSFAPFDLESTTSSGLATGLAIVAPDTVGKHELAELGHLLEVDPAPVLGVITYRTKRRRPRTPIGSAHRWEL